MPKIEIKGTVIKKYSFSLPELIEMLKFDPKSVTGIVVNIPGGGDYSNCTLSIGEEIDTLDVIVKEEI